MKVERLEGCLSRNKTIRVLTQGALYAMQRREYIHNEIIVEGECLHRFFWGKQEWQASEVGFSVGSCGAMHVGAEDTNFNLNEAMLTPNEERFSDAPLMLIHLSLYPILMSLISDDQKWKPLQCHHMSCVRGEFEEFQRGVHTHRHSGI